MRIGVDLGGTKIEAIALAGDGTVRARHRVPTPAGDYAGTLRAIADLVFGLEQALGEKASVGIASPGAISPATGLMKNSNSVVLNGKPLDRDLAQVLARPIRLENDANCFAVSEAVDGAGKGAPVVFGVILGTGVGGGIAIGGKALSGHHRIAGEWGHNPLPWPRDDERPGPSCYCGKKGCIETFLSGPGLAQDFFARTGQRATPEDILSAREKGDPQARACLADYHDRLARALATVINVLDPDIVVLGGGLSNMGDLYPSLRQRIGHYAFSDRIDTPIVPAKHGDSSGVRGAAWLWD
jgi:fructokinase